MIQISEERYAELLRAEYKLESLELYGVDNWADYVSALNNVFDDDMPSAWEFCHWPDDKIINYWEERD